MKLTVERDTLRHALSIVKPAVQRNAAAALAGVLIEATCDGVTLTASNIDTTIRTSMPCGVDIEQGRVLVYHDPLDRLAGSTAGTVELSEQDGFLHIHAGTAKARLRTLDASTFPQAPPLDAASDDYQTVKLDDAWAAIQRVAAFRSVDTTRPILTGIHLNAEAGVVETTDSFRLARHALADVPADLLLAPGAVAAATRACPDGPVMLRSQGRRFELEADGTVWSGHVIEGQFPSVKSLIPTTTPVSLTVEREDLLAAIRTVTSIESPDEVVPVRLRQDEATGLVTVLRPVRDRGDAEVELTAHAVSGNLTYAFNATFLAQLLGALHDDTVTLSGTDAVKPWVMREGDFLGLLMPVRVA